jgi:hypothetical protein
MKLPQPYNCDYCGKLKGESNHWWLVDPDLYVTGIHEAFVLLPWNMLSFSGARTEHICSQECASKALSQWMSQQTSQPTASNASGR